MKRERVLVCLTWVGVLVFCVSVLVSLIFGVMALTAWLTG